MKRFLVFVFVISFILSIFSSCASGNAPVDPDDTDISPEEEIAAGKIFYVSTEGDDTADGSKENPLASMKGAVETVRRYKAENGLPEGGIRVEFAEGRYYVTESNYLTNEDSGAEGKPIVYCAAEGAEVIFDGGIALDPADFLPANDEIKARIQNDAAREALLEIDLVAAGCYDLTQHTDAYGNGWNSHEHNQELFVDNKRQTLAKWPNESAYATTGRHDSETGDAYLNIPEEKFELWKDIENIGYYGAPAIEWDMRHVFPGDVEIDKEKKALVLKGKGFVPDESPSLWVNNIPEELDVPGEYWWDTDTNILYYYPDGDISESKICFSQLAAPFFAPSDTHYMTFDGLTFENFRSPIFFNEGEGTRFIRNSHYVIKNCVFRCMGVNAIGLFCDAATVKDSVFYEIGATAVCIRSGDTKAWTNTNTVITNNLMYDFSQVYMTNTPAVNTDGIGFVVSHNEIYNSTTHAIDIGSGETVVEYNKIHDVCTATGDSSAIYLGRRWDWSGNTIRYNYVYDIADKAHGRAPSAIYMDDQVSGQHIYGNVLVNIAGLGVINGGGKYNTIENNIFINCGIPIGSDDRGLNFSYEIAIYNTGYLWSSLLDTDPHSDIMRLARPSNLLQAEKSVISSIYNIDDPGIGSYCTIRGNVAYGCVSDAPWVDRDYEGNVYEDTVTFDGVSNSNPPIRLYCTTEGNKQYPAGTDIGFVDFENEDYTLRDDSVVFRDIIGFEKIDFTKIGRLTK